MTRTFSNTVTLKYSVFKIKITVQHFNNMKSIIDIIYSEHDKRYLSVSL